MNSPWQLVNFAFHRNVLLHYFKKQLKTSRYQTTYRSFFLYHFFNLNILVHLGLVQLQFGFQRYGLQRVYSWCRSLPLRGLHWLLQYVSCPLFKRPLVSLMVFAKINPPLVCVLGEDGPCLSVQSITGELPGNFYFLLYRRWILEIFEEFIVILLSL